MNYSVCIDNKELQRVSQIGIDWDTPFLKLCFDREKAKEKFFADNGKNWQYSDTNDSFKTVILDISLDDHDHISGLSMYKYQSTSFGHGKNTSRELTVSSADRKACLAKLQEVVTDPSEEELNKLLSTIQQNDFGKEREVLIRKNDITILDENGTKQTIKKKALLKAIQISHIYLEVLRNEKVFELCPKEFPTEIWPVLHEILSFINTDDYYQIDELQYRMNMRDLVASADVHFPQLRQAVIDGDLEKVKQLAPYAKLVVENKTESAPLYFAVKANYLDIAKVLLENGAYAIEMEKDGSRFPLEVAYQNKNMDMIRLLVKYHGAMSKTFFVTKHNTDNLIKACAADKNYEVMKLLAPEAFTFDTRTWFSPDMFPDMKKDTIQAISNCQGIRMAWGLAQIRPVYKKKDYDLCKRMLLQGSTQEVVEFFIADGDYELFEASLQCHINLNRYGAYAPVFERGGKWYDALAKHVINLGQTESRFFETLLNNGNVDRYLEINQQRGYPFIGLTGYMVWPEKVTDPEKYIKLVKVFIDKAKPGKGSNLFLDDIIKYFGDEQLAKDYYCLHQLKPDTNWRPFRESSITRSYLWDEKVKNPYAGAELVRSFFSQDVEDKTKKCYDLVLDLLRECYRRFPSEMIEDEAGLSGKEIRCLYMLRVVMEFITVKEIEDCLRQEFGRIGINSLAQYVKDKNIRSKLVLQLLNL